MKSSVSFCVSLLLFVGSGLLFGIGGCAAPSDKKPTISPVYWEKTLESLSYNRQYAIKRSRSDVPYLIKALDYKDPLVRLNAVQDLKTMGPEAVSAAPTLIGRFDDRHEKTASVSHLAVQSFGPLGEDSLPALKTTLGSRKVRTRVWSLELIQAMGARARALVPELIACLGSTSNSVRVPAENLLIGMSDEEISEGTLAALARTPKNPPPSVNEELLEALRSAPARIKPSLAFVVARRKLPDAGPVFEQLLAKKDFESRLAGAWGLAQSGSADKRKETHNVLEQSLARTKGSQRERSLSLLRSSGGSSIASSFLQQQQRQVEVVKAKREVEKEEKKNYETHRVLSLAGRARRSIARERLERKNPSEISRWHDQLTFISGLLESGNSQEQVTAVFTLQNLALYFDEAIDPLVGALGSQDEEVRAAAAQAIGELRCVEGVDALIGQLKDPSVRDTAASALAGINTPKAQAAVRNTEKQIGAVAPPKAITSRASGRITAREARSVCRALLIEEGTHPKDIPMMTKECVRATGATY